MKVSVRVSLLAALLAACGVGGVIEPDAQKGKNDCSPNPCQNSGTCTKSQNGFTCECLTGFAGDTCSETVSQCANNPCLNDGICLEVTNGYSCDCAGGYSGPLCATAPVVCAPNPCANGGRCFAQDDTFRCDCTLAFTGDTCADARATGMNTRPSNTTCIAPARPAMSGPLAWGSGQDSGEALMMLRQAPDGTWYGAYRSGQVYTVNLGDGPVGNPIHSVATNTSGEMGMLGLALHPEFATSPYLYVYYTTGGQGSNVVLHVDGCNTQTSVCHSVWSWNRGQPWSHHIGGTLEFDPLAATPTLYLATGDGGDIPNACANNVAACPSQNSATFNGKLLRFVLTAPAAQNVTPDIVGYGLRNPFRWSFDSLTGDLWIGDVGESNWEEVDFVPYADVQAAGDTPLNFGWPCFEGNAFMYPGNNAAQTFCNGVAAAANYVPPSHVYDHTVGVSVIGGRVYRGAAIAGAQGTYLFNDIFPQSEGDPSWQLVGNHQAQDASQTSRSRLEEGGFVGYTEDVTGELYSISHYVVRRLEAGGGTGPTETMPSLLSETGCFSAGGNPASGLIPFDVQAPLWSDAATKRRWLAIPNGTSITFNSQGDFEFPPGTVLAKEFTQGGVRVETRLFVRHPDGVWQGYTYAWMDGAGNALSDATLLDTPSATRNIPGAAGNWVFPSRAQCLSCHTQAAGFSLGLEVAQLNGDMLYSGSGVTANQLHTLSEIGVVSSSIASIFAAQTLPHYDNANAPLERRAHAYLHSNCSGCHRAGGPGFGGRSNMPDTSYSVLGNNTPLATRLCGVAATADNLGLGAGAQLVEPGVPGDWDSLGSGGSVLYLRMLGRPNAAGASFAMPPLGTRIVDTVHGAPLVEAWITSLQCP